MTREELRRALRTVRGGNTRARSPFRFPWESSFADSRLRQDIVGYSCGCSSFQRDKNEVDVPEVPADAGVQDARTRD
jgi:hypothetical protein